jgi:four helix bundle protein
MSEIKNYRDLIVWQKAMTLAKEIYEATRAYPKGELFGLTQQLRRAAVSIPSNIAEGNGRGTKPDYIRFLQIARGSLFEAQTQIELSRDLSYLPDGVATQLCASCNEIERMLNSLITKLGI